MFPDKQLSLRSEVFKIASLIAEGYTFSLVIHVLANIYSGLHQVHDSTSSLGHFNACFHLHYVHGWLALIIKPLGVLGFLAWLNFLVKVGPNIILILRLELLTNDGELINWNASFL